MLAYFPVKGEGCLREDRPLQRETLLQPVAPHSEGGERAECESSRGASSPVSPRTGTGPGQPETSEGKTHYKPYEQSLRQALTAFCLLTA